MNDKLKQARDWCRRTYNKRRPSREHEHPSFLVEEVLSEAEKRFNLPTFGVEGWATDFGRSGVHYLNTGDSYGTTIVARCNAHSARFSVGCWASYA